ncbi:hypothetical protein KP806_20075 [Paenibacillus sp. N4]|nr:hypothetical protein [Paenibacillus vietnamensis]MCA0757359.1 hypothetical protein [Paenibacillus vietnamensis]
MSDLMQKCSTARPTAVHVRFLLQFVQQIGGRSILVAVLLQFVQQIGGR